MRTVLCSRAGRSALIVAVVAAVSGASVLPALASSDRAPGTGPTTQPDRPTVTRVADRHDGVVLGPATKYARTADGTVVRVR